MFQRALHNEFRERDIRKQAATVVTQVLVNADDPAFQAPSKPIGSFMEQDMALTRQDEEGWSVVEDAGRGWRRVVPSPDPKQIVQEDAIVALINAGIVTIAVGGGGIPVVKDAQGNLEGVEAVIDKDFASSLLASNIGADLFLISTAVEKVALNFNKPEQQWIDELNLDQAKQYLSEGHFAKGSMEPKIQSVVRYLENGGKRAIITDPENIERALAGETGTHLVP
jgi:carbamate kinase